MQCKKNTYPNAYLTLILFCARKSFRMVVMSCAGRVRWCHERGASHTLPLGGTTEISKLHVMNCQLSLSLSRSLIVLSGPI